MRLLVLGLAMGLAVMAAPARAIEPTAIGPADAKAHVGQTVTVEGAVSSVHKAASGVTFVDLGGQFPDNAFAAVIFAADAAKFPNVAALDGKTVAITGPVVLYNGKSEIILKSADQVKAK
jgi:DNA/RNA endonuclease YhcR with UshA esterase domain